MTSACLRFGILGALAIASVHGAVADDEPTADQAEFFEKEVRPILVEYCHKCHGPNVQKGGLRLDSRDGVLKGGETGPAVQPGDVKASLLIDAINYDPDGYQMPPDGKLPAEKIGVLAEWVRRGAPWPKSAAAGGDHVKAFDLAERATHWSFQRLQRPAIPDVRNADQAANPIDRFLLSRLESHELRFSPPAERSIQLRRLSIELTGLPPTPEELEAFLADAAPDAYERVVDRLLASPRYGERWARHWLDLVRFAETYGHEFDYEIRFARPYRDYVIRAWNADVPYDQFVREHVAGDLLPDPRRDVATGKLESVIGTAFWWFGQGKHSPVDIRAEECDTVDNQLDVFGKTFLGLTVACARCHDHKFDPISQKDYYALAGYLQSSRQTYADVNPPEWTAGAVSELERNDRAHRSHLLLSALDRLQPFVDRVADLLLSKGEFAPNALEAWHKRWKEEATNDPRHPLHLWVHWSADPRKLSEQKRALEQFRRQFADAAERARRETAILNPPAIGANELDAWFAEGFAFDLRPRSKLTWLTQASAERPLRGAVAPQTWAHSGLVSPKLQGTLRSPTFTIDKPYLDIWACRRGGSPQPLRGDYKAGQIHLIVDGFQIIKDPLYGFLTINVAQKELPTWYRRDVSRFLGCKAYLEIDDPDDGEIVVERMQLTDQGPPPQPFNELISRALNGAKIESLADVAMVHQHVLQDVVKRLRNEELYGVPAFRDDELPAAADLVNWLLREETVSIVSAPAGPTADDFAVRRRELETAIPAPERTLAMTVGSPENERLLIRGNHKKPGEEVPRRFLEVFGSTHNPASTRLELAERLVDGTNPLVPRVIVNRLWQHQFGRGIVSTPDDFGKMGQPPTHPELLDWLASELARGGWSLKRMQRLMATSAAFRQSSRVETQGPAETLDPDNLLLHRANIQRLEAEALRDGLLLMSGRLDDRMYGESVLPHLTEFMEGRGRPGQSGPLDGNGRRSIYINVRRNFLTPMFLAFDFPTPFTTMGRRSTSNVPAQALTLMNNPFVVQQAQLWVANAGSSSPSTRERIQRLYVTAFSRRATDEELGEAEEFLATQAAEYGGAAEPRAWTDLAHVLLNVKEFAFVE